MDHAADCCRRNSRRAWHVHDLCFQGLFVPLGRSFGLCQLPYHDPVSPLVDAQFSCDVANCNDCHVPHENIARKYLFKAKDGLYHSYVFTMRSEPMAIRPRTESYQVIMNNCIRCHSQLNQDFVKTGMITYVEATEHGMGKACWDCHRNVPHGTISSLASSPNAPLTPLPKSPVPDWLKQMLK